MPVVEDDAAIRRGIVDALGYEGFRVVQAADGDDGLDKAISVTCDLILLDLVLPGRSTGRGGGPGSGVSPGEVVDGVCVHRHDMGLFRMMWACSEAAAVAPAREGLR